jgi:hypothetical protein
MAFLPFGTDAVVRNADNIDITTNLPTRQDADQSLQQEIWLKRNDPNLLTDSPATIIFKLL